jgi:hypothetical protein
MHARKQSVSGQSRDPRVGIASGNEDTHLGAGVVIPFNREAVGDIFGSDAHLRWEMIWPKVSKTDEADAADRPTSDQLRTKRRWELALDYFRVDPIVHEQTSLDRAFDRVGEHVRPPWV